VRPAWVAETGLVPDGPWQAKQIAAVRPAWVAGRAMATPPAAVGAVGAAAVGVAVAMPVLVGAAGAAVGFAGAWVGSTATAGTVGLGVGVASAPQAVARVKTPANTRTRMTARPVVRLLIDVASSPSDWCHDNVSRGHR
jgi:hypothetical protein